MAKKSEKGLRCPECGSRDKFATLDEWRITLDGNHEVIETEPATDDWNHGFECRACGYYGDRRKFLVEEA
jgi:rubredoxin